ncbi:MAG: NUDIX hydrolase [Candidatus Eisenbacteria bacterium]
MGSIASPTGGVNDDENILDAARRRVRRKPVSRSNPSGSSSTFSTGRPAARHLVPLLRVSLSESDGPIVPEDTGEEIDDWRVVSWSSLPETIFGLENLERMDRLGTVRALAHSFLLDVMERAPTGSGPRAPTIELPAR